MEKIKTKKLFGQCLICLGVITPLFIFWIVQGQS